MRLWILLLCMVCASTSWAEGKGIIGGPGPALLYGSSHTAKSGPAGDCDWCAGIIEAGYTVFNAAVGGASFGDETGSGPTCTAGNSYGATFCADLIRQAIHTDGSCRNLRDLWLDTNLEPTCMDDVLMSGMYVTVLEGGTNDVIPGDPISWPGIHEPAFQAAADDLMDRIVAKNTACVIITAPPRWESGAGSTLQDRLDDNEARDANQQLLNAYLISESALRAPRCQVLNFHQAVLDVETNEGEAAMLALYANCPAKGSELSFDCTHMGASGNAMLSEMVVPYFRAAQKWMRDNDP